MIIHLLNRRRHRTVHWAAMDFLREALQRNRRILQMRDLLLLLMRCAAILLFGLALALSLLTACATSPTGRRQLMIVSEDRAIAASKNAYVEMIKPYEKKGKVDNDPALKDRVYQITGRLIAQAINWRPETKDWEWSIKVIDDPKTVNAWAMAGGKMAIYSGLAIQLKATDDELAQVLGHEIGHALANHSAEKMSVAMASTIGVVAVGVASDNKAVALTGAALAAALVILRETNVSPLVGDS